MSVFSIDDPMLALIARFALCCEDPQVSEAAFLRQQCDQIREYVKDVSEDQRGTCKTPHRSGFLLNSAGNNRAAALAGVKIWFADKTNRAGK